LRTIVPEVDVLLASSYTRAWQTAGLLREEAGWPAPERCPALEGSGPLANVLEELQKRRERDSIALVGHEPQLSLLVSLLVSGVESALRLELKKGAASLVSFQGGPARGEGVLRWSLSPRILRVLAETG
jgi:phosphohistidine phosphatase SixA